MAIDGLIELYDPREYLCGEIILVEAREVRSETLSMGEYTTAEPCCRVTAKSRKRNSHAVVTKKARVVLQDQGKGKLPLRDLRDMMNKILIGEVLIIEGHHPGRRTVLHGSSAHRGTRIEVCGNNKHLVFATIDEPAEVHHHMVNRSASAHRLSR